MEKRPIFQKSQLLGIAITFVVGLFSGWYLYIFGFSMQFKIFDLQTNMFYDDFAIVGEEYGGCSMAGGNCPSFQLLADGSFRYAPGLGGDNGQGIIVGTMPKELVDELNEVADEENLEQASALVEKDDCDLLDTCRTDLDSNRNLKNSIDEIWNYFRNNT
jgi:hypothetical protein